MKYMTHIQAPLDKTLHIWTFHRNCRYNSHLIEDLYDITEALTQNIVVQTEISNLNIF